MVAKTSLSVTFIRTFPIFLSPPPENHAVYEIMWKDMVVPYKPHMAVKIRHVNFACCISKATEAHTEYVILLFRGNSAHAKAPQFYVIRALPVSLF
jgi:hypothetical protein